MIERMKKVYIVARRHEKKQMLFSLRDAGVLHVIEKKISNPELQAKLNQLRKMKVVLSESKTKEKPAILSDEDFDALNRDLIENINKREELIDLISRTNQEVERVEPWGDFSLSDISYLKEKGMLLEFKTMERKEFDKNSNSFDSVVLSRTSKQVVFCLINSSIPKEINSKTFLLPEKNLAEMKIELEKANSQIKQINSNIVEKSKFVNSYDAQIKSVLGDIKFDTVSQSTDNDDKICWLSGFLPVSELEGFKKLAKKNNWGYLIDDPNIEEEIVPTKVKYNKVTKIIKPLFDIMGTVPGYNEFDTSLPFLLFFSLFFAMIIGDAAYGLLFVVLAVFMNIKSKKLSDANLLIYVLGISTVIWGSLTGTWFGTEGAMNISFLKALVIPSITNFPDVFGIDSKLTQNMVMKFCFLIGTIHLTLACIMSVYRKIKERNLSLVADLGWLAMINALYFVVLMLVIGEDVNFMLSARIVGISFVLVILFGAQEPGKSFAKGIADGLAGAFTTFLDSIGAFGNILSYIRLFAVGMSTMAIAQSFNDMASGFGGWLVPVAIFILVLGHSLNLVMGLLSVVVHGVRLNLLEFSGQLGMEWSGIAYEPFGKN